MSKKQMNTNLRSLALIVCALALHHAQAAPENMPLYSDFAEVKGQATGHIHTEKIDGRHWFIDANGYAFFPVGMTHTRFFENTVELVNKGDAYGCACHAFNILSNLNLNACAALSDKPQKKAALERKFAYCKSIFPMVTPHSSTYKKPDVHRADPFSAAFEQETDKKIQSSTRGNAADPHIIGFSYGFNPFQLMHKWINHFLATPNESPARQAIIDQVFKTTYKHIGALNAVYGTTFTSFDELSIQYDPSLNPRPEEVVAENDLQKRDFNNITCLLIAKVHEVAHQKMRHYAPDKLILGYYMKPYNMNLDMYEAIAPYVDVLSPQHLHIVAYKQGTYNKARGVLPVEEISARTGKPIYISDMALGKVYTQNNKPSQHNVYGSYHSQTHRGKVYYAAVKKAAALPQVIGFSGCMTIYDNPNEKGQHGGNKGYISPFTAQKKADFTDYVGAINSQIYSTRMGENNIPELTQALIDAMDQAVR